MVFLSNTSPMTRGIIKGILYGLVSILISFSNPANYSLAGHIAGWQFIIGIILFLTMLVGLLFHKSFCKGYVLASLILAVSSIIFIGLGTLYLGFSGEGVFGGHFSVSIQTIFTILFMVCSLLPGFLYTRSIKETKIIEGVHTAYTYFYGSLALYILLSYLKV